MTERRYLSHGGGVNSTALQLLLCDIAGFIERKNEEYRKAVSQ